MVSSSEIRELIEEVRMLREAIKRKNKGRIVTVCGESVDEHGLDNLIIQHFSRVDRTDDITLPPHNPT